MTIGIGSQFKNPNYQGGIKSASFSSATQNQPIASYNLAEVTDTKKETSDGLKMLGAILGVGFLGLFVSRGFSSAFNQRIKELLINVKSKIVTESVKTKTENMSSSFMAKVHRGSEKLFEWLDASSNITALKDSLVTKAMLLTPFTKKIMGSINNLFRKIAVKSSDKSYKVVSGMQEDLVSEATKLLGKDSAELKALQEIYQNSFSKTARDSRIENIYQSVKGLYEKVSSRIFENGVFGFFKNPKKFKTYITTDLIQNDKTVFQNGLISQRRLFSNNLQHKSDEIKALLTQIKIGLPSQHLTSENLKKIKHLEDLALEYKTASPETILKLEKSISDEVSALKEVLGNSQNITDIGNILKTKEGALQELLGAVGKKHGVDSAQYKEFKVLANKVSKNLDDAVNLEKNNLFDKLAEIEVGSAPTDILGLAIPAGLGGYFVATADGKDEKVGTAFKTGIPIVGAVGTALYGTIRMFSGVKNLALGLGAGWALNLIGNWANTTYISKAQNKTFINEQLASMGINPKNPRNNS